jgi:hypothetical protein
MADDPIKLTEHIKELVNGALMGGYPMLLATVNAQGQPRLSFRGSLAVFSDDQLGFWARNGEGETMEAIAGNPNVSMMLRKPDTRAMLQFTGRARIATGADRDKVYDSAPEFERRADPEKKGVGVVVDLDRVEGGWPGENGERVRVRMVRGS